MRQQLGPTAPGELLCDGIGDSPRADTPELAAWSDWAGPRVSPKRILGEGLMAAAAWQCVAACDAVASRSIRRGQRQPGRLQPTGRRRPLCARRVNLDSLFPFGFYCRAGGPMGSISP